MSDYPLPLFDVSTFTVDDTITESELIEVQNLHIRPVLGNALYADFIANITAPKYSVLKEFAGNCAKRWLYYRSLSKKMAFKDFLENSTESPDVFVSSINSALQLAKASSAALLHHVNTSDYELYVKPSKRTVAGFRIKT
jgi:hypothetical protein